MVYVMYKMQSHSLRIYFIFLTLYNMSDDIQAKVEKRLSILQAENNGLAEELNRIATETQKLSRRRAEVQQRQSEIQGAVNEFAQLVGTDKVKKYLTKIQKPVPKEKEKVKAEPKEKPTKPEKPEEKSNDAPADAKVKK